MADGTADGTAAAEMATATDGVRRAGRRGILAAAAAAVASIAARQTVAAGMDGDVVLGGNNNTTTATYITNSTAGSTALLAYCDTGIGTNGYGLYGQGTGYGVRGIHPPAGKTSGAGVYGTTGRADGYGVLAESFSGSGSTALYANIGGYAAGYAAIGTTTGAGSVGVYGSSTQYAGVYGSSGSQTGTLGVSQNGNGVYGVTTGTNVAGVYGTATGAGSNSYGIEGVAGASGTGAGKFTGLVYINGPLVIAGGGKSAAVPHPDGSQRLLYCVESPEAWFEDFGEGKLIGGRAEVRLDPDFAAVIDTTTMHVFAMPHSDEHHLSVTGRAGQGFTVTAGPTATAATRGVRAGQASGTFSYRVVAKRKDIKAERLARFVPPGPNARPTPLAAEPPTPPVPEKKER